MRMSDVLGQFLERTAVSARTLPGIFERYITITKGKIESGQAQKVQRQTSNVSAQLFLQRPSFP